MGHYLAIQADKVPPHPEVLQVWRASRARLWTPRWRGGIVSEDGKEAGILPVLYTLVVPPIAPWKSGAGQGFEPTGLRLSQSQTGNAGAPDQPSSLNPIGDHRVAYAWLASDVTPGDIFAERLSGLLCCLFQSAPGRDAGRYSV